MFLSSSSRSSSSPSPSSFRCAPPPSRALCIFLAFFLVHCYPAPYIHQADGATIHSGTNNGTIEGIEIAESAEMGGEEMSTEQSGPRVFWITLGRNRTANTSSQVPLPTPSLPPFTDEQLTANSILNKFEMDEMVPEGPPCRMPKARKKSGGGEGGGMVTEGPGGMAGGAGTVSEDGAVLEKPRGEWGGGWWWTSTRPLIRVKTTTERTYEGKEEEQKIEERKE